VRCKDARYLISFDMDNELTASQSGDLEDHLRICDKCRDYKVSIANVSHAIKLDSDYISNISFDAPAFQLKLHKSFVEEHQKSSIRIPGWANAFVPKISSLENQRSYCIFRSISFVAGAVIAGIFLLYISFSVPSIPGKDFGNGHIAAFTTHKDKEGRVYADLRVHISQSRDYSKEKLQ
jgi:hypothetical protein